MPLSVVKDNDDETVVIDVRRADGLARIVKPDRRIGKFADEPLGHLEIQAKLPSRNSRSIGSGMRNPKVMASMNGGAFLYGLRLAPPVGLKVLTGMDLNQSGRPATAGIGRGNTVSIPAG
jgi:hypothetical protein